MRLHEPPRAAEEPPLRLDAQPRARVREGVLVTGHLPARLPGAVAGSTAASSTVALWGACWQAQGSPAHH